MDDWRCLLKDKVVFITGAAGWIGRHVAKTCYEHGARVVLADRVKAELLSDEKKIDDERIFVVSLDVEDEKTIEQAVQLTLNKWQTIDMLVNTAAIFTLGFVEDVSADDWTSVMNVNVRGYALVVKHIVPTMKKNMSGVIVNIASAAGRVAVPTFLPYATSKGAIIQLSRNLACDLGPFNIRVNSISPGAIDSPTLDRTAEYNGLTREEFNREHSGKCLGRLGRPQEVANLIVFLLSDLCPFLSGTDLPLDGGFTSV